MSIKSDNVKGNPYHDEKTGEFTSEGSSSQKVLDKMGLNSVSIDNDFSLASVIPQTNRDGSRRIRVSQKGTNRMEYYKKWKQIYEMSTMKEDGKSDIEPTIKISTPDRFKMRRSLKENEMARQEQTPKRYERQVTIIFGLPASGKTFLTNSFKDKFGAYEVDSDIFTHEIPEFKKDPSQISAVHAEATIINRSFMNDIMSKGGNMVIGKVGGDVDTKSLENMFNQLEQNGYKINLVLNDLPVDESLRRNLQRHKDGEPRLVPAYVPIIADAFIHGNFEKLMKHNAVTSGSVYSNDVPFGEHARLLKEWKKGE